MPSSFKSVIRSLSPRGRLARYAGTCVLVALASWAGPTHAAAPDAAADAAADEVVDKAAAQRPQVQVETSLGSFVIELYPRKAPVTVANFLRLVKEEYYDGLIFHRVIPNFMVQGGGYTPELVLRNPGPDIANESDNGLKNRKGMVAMARLTDPDTANSQFYVNAKDNSHLDATRSKPGYTVFGRVIDGWRTISAIELVDTGRRDGMAGVPVETVLIKRIRRR